MRYDLSSEQIGVVRHFVYERDKGRCVDCGANVVEERGHWASMHLAHIRSKGADGSWCPTNLLTKCLVCHMREHAGGKPVPKKIQEGETDDDADGRGN